LTASFRYRLTSSLAYRDKLSVSLCVFVRRCTANMKLLIVVSKH
jgi:hypothetical protein